MRVGPVVPQSVETPPSQPIQPILFSLRVRRRSRSRSPGRILDGTVQAASRTRFTYRCRRRGQDEGVGSNDSGDPAM
jgi:hypothetical protein